MLFATDIDNLLSEWREHLKFSCDNSYSAALNKCITDLDTLLSDTIEEELNNKPQS